MRLGKQKPKIKTPFKVYIYCTVNGTTAKERDRNIFTDLRGKVIGEYVCDSIDTLLESDTRGKWKDTAKASCLTFQQLDEYSGTDEKPLYLWHISNLKIYEKPKELGEFGKYCNKNCYKQCPHYLGKEYGCEGLQIERPPQSWCYVEEVKICQ